MRKGPVQVLQLSRIWTLLQDHGAAQVPQAYLWHAVAFGTGTGLYFALPFEPTFWPVFIIVGMSVLWAWGARHSPLMFALAVLTFGYGWAGTAAHRVSAPVLEKRMYVTVEGRVIGTDRSASDKMRITLAELTISDLSDRKTPARVRIAMHGPGPPPAIGARVETIAHLSPPPGPAEPYGFDFQRHAWFLQLGGVGYTRKAVKVIKPPDRTTLATVRAGVTAWIYAGLTPETRGIAVAITTGDRSYLKPKAVDALREANLAHLLAISGLHMGLLAGLIFGMLRVVLLVVPRIDPRRCAAVGALLAAATYLALSGASIATERAFVMTSVILIAVVLRRRALTLRGIALAVWIVLLLRPQAIFSPGFHMSFAATIALILAFQWITDRGWMRKPGVGRYLTSSVLSAFVAGAATAPFAAAHFNMIPHYGVVANVLAVPLMASVVMPGVIAAVALSPLGLDFIGFAVIDLGLTWIVNIATMVAGWDGAISLIKSPPPMALPIFTIGAIFFVLWRGLPRWGGGLAVGLACILWFNASRPDILIADNGALVGVLGPEGRVMSREKGSGFSARVWLENDGDDALQYVSFARAAPRQKWVQPVRKLEEDAELCQDTPWVVPKYQERTECLIFDLRTLRNTGSVAGYIENGQVIWVSAKGVSGRRLWNDKWVRRDAMVDHPWSQTAPGVLDQ